MKADILRRAQEVSDDEENRYVPATGGMGRREFISFDDDEFDDDFGNVSVVGDGETSDGEDEDVEEKVCTSTAYIPHVADHDGRSLWRRGLKSLTLKVRLSSIVMRRPGNLLGGKRSKPKQVHG
jgi:hypothetical protein